MTTLQYTPDRRLPMDAVAREMDRVLRSTTERLRRLPTTELAEMARYDSIQSLLARTVLRERSGAMA